MSKNVFERFNGLFMMMAVPTPENVITGIIGKIKKADRGDRALEIINGCATSTYVTITPADILIYRGHLTTFNAVGTPSQKKSRWLIVYDDLKILLSTFQLAATANQPDSINILESGKFRIKGMGGSSKNVFDVFNTDVSGTVRITGPVMKKRHCHDWKYSSDGITYIRFTPSINAEIFIPELVVGQKYWFQHQLIDKDGPTGPLETKFITVT